MGLACAGAGPYKGMAGSGHGLLTLVAVRDHFGLLFGATASLMAATRAGRSRASNWAWRCAVPDSNRRQADTNLHHRHGRTSFKPHSSSAIWFESGIKCPLSRIGANWPKRLSAGGAD